MLDQVIAKSIFLIPTFISLSFGIAHQEVKQVEPIVSAEAEAEPPSRYVIPREKDIREIAHSKIVQTFGEGNWSSFDKLVQKESGWNPTAQNPRSTAYGLCQFLNSTWENGKSADPERQLDECINYIKNRYENPNGAWSFHLGHNWY